MNTDLLDNNGLAKEQGFITHDGIELFYRYWPSTSKKPKGAIVLFHRGHEHSGRLTHIVEELGMHDYSFFAWDARGHGLSPGERGYSPSIATSIRDVQTFIDHISATYSFEEERIAIIAQSVGAVLVSAWVHDYAPKIRCMILASPAFKVKLYVPFARTGLKLIQKRRKNFFVNSYVKAKFLTHDPDRIESFDNDPLVTRAISSNILLSLYETAERVVADAAAITVPTQLLISGSDWVVHHKPQHQFYVRLGSLAKERHILDGFYHDTLGEKDRHIAIDKMRCFIQQSFAVPLSRQNLENADKIGFTRTESDKLATPDSLLSSEGIYWALYRQGLKISGLQSEGIKLGHETGFDSGSTLDYIYENKPQGTSILGKLIDKNYLNAVGWRGIRQRKINIEELLQIASSKLRAQGNEVNIMDIASGHGRYILEAIERGAKGNQHRPNSILLRDYSDLNVENGNKLITEKGLADIAQFIKADAFDAESYINLDTQPTLGVVSGLYELFADNDLVRISLNGLASAIQSGGYLIYTGQPWHPQLKMIAKALTSHRQGRAWVMRRRSQEEMDQLVAAAGFTKIEQRIDQFGIFTVSLAVRNNDI
ncbi:MAG: alpha/beta fold hydrolase [Gammaproteobacteria bacterium]|nr:alpha/beta fold hydrolase [Gammaproteobacteria bacterium]